MARCLMISSLNLCEPILLRFPKKSCNWKYIVNRETLHIRGGSPRQPARVRLVSKFRQSSEKTTKEDEIIFYHIFDMN